MKNYISLSKYPGKTGEFFYNSLFNHHAIDATYTALRCDNLNISLQKAIQENVSGISVSMPHKKTIINCLDNITYDCDIYQSCNTVVNHNGALTGYNCDLAGVIHTCGSIDANDSVTVLGDGAMATMYVQYLKDFNVTQCARKLNTWELRHQPCDVIINATGMGTSCVQSPYHILPSQVKLVIDLSVMPGQLQAQCMASDIKYLSGREFYKQQFKVQFKIYTGMEPDDHIYNKLNKAFFA